MDTDIEVLERMIESRCWATQEERAALNAAIALMRGQSEMVLVPRELTAENGAKAALISEFSFRDGLGNEHNVPWHVIKVIHKAMVAHFHPKQEPAE